MPLNINDDMPIGRPPSGKIGSRQQPAINAPDQLAEQGAAALAAPDTLASLSRPTLSAPDALISRARPTLSAPDALISRARPALPAPDILTSKPADLVAPPFPLNHARILWDNILRSAELAVSPSSMTSASAIRTPSTYSRAQWVGPGVIVFTFASGVSVDSLGLAAHNLQGVRVLIQYRATSSDPYTVVYDKVAGPGAFFMSLAAPVVATQIRIQINAEADRACQIGVIYAGTSLQMQRPLYRGADPATLNRVTQYTNNVSEGGQWLGRDIIRQGLKTKPRWQNLDPVWLRGYFDPFASAARRLPFFYSWNPLEFPNDVAYCWTSKDIQPTITGPRNLMSVEIEMEGHA